MIEEEVAYEKIAEKQSRTADVLVAALRCGTRCSSGTQLEGGSDEILEVASSVGLLKSTVDYGVSVKAELSEALRAKCTAGKAELEEAKRTISELESQLKDLEAEVQTRNAVSESTESKKQELRELEKELTNLETLEREALSQVAVVVKAKSQKEEEYAAKLRLLTIQHRLLVTCTGTTLHVDETEGKKEPLDKNSSREGKGAGGGGGAGAGGGRKGERGVEAGRGSGGGRELAGESRLSVVGEVLDPVTGTKAAAIRAVADCCDVCPTDRSTAEQKRLQAESLWDTLEKVLTGSRKDRSGRRQSEMHYGGR